MAENIRVEAQNMIDWFKKYSRERINSRLMDERRTLSPTIIQDLGDAGIFKMFVPERFGGKPLSTFEIAKVVEQIAAFDPALGVCVMNNNVLGIRPIVKYASSSIQEEFLPKLTQGHILAGLGASELGAGSNPMAIVTTATKSNEESWLLNGTKIWIGNAAWAKIINIFARVKNEETNRDEITGFVVRTNSPGFAIGEEALTMGMRSFPQNRIDFHDVKVGIKDRLGGPAQGTKVLIDSFSYGRLLIGAGAIGSIKTCIQFMYRYASNRQIVTGRLIDNPVTSEIFTNALVKLYLLESLVNFVALRMDRNEEIEEELFILCKNCGAEFAFEIVDSAMQMLGARGYMENNMVPQFFRDIRALRIFEGPTEALYMQLGMKILRGSLKSIKKILSTDLLNPKVEKEFLNFLDQLREKLIASKLSPVNEERILLQLSVHVGELAAFYILLGLSETPQFNVEVKPFAPFVIKRKIHSIEFLIEKIISEKSNISSEVIAQFSKTFREEVGEIQRSASGIADNMDAILEG